MKRSELTGKVGAVAWLLAGLMGGCGGATPPAQSAESPPVSKATVTEQPAEPAEPTAAAELSKPPEATETEEPAKPKGQRRPMAIFNDSTEPVTVGVDGAVFRLQGGAEVRIPYGAFGTPRNVLFSVNSKAKGTAGKLGEVYTIQLWLPEMQIDLAKPRTSSPVESSSDPFVIKLPIPGQGQSANLAVETMTVDDKGKAASQWAVVARTKLETSDDGDKAVFELLRLPDGAIHLTSKAAD